MFEQCYEVTIATTTQQAEFVSDLLMGMGSLGVSESTDDTAVFPQKLLAYFPVTETPEELRAKLTQQLSQAGVNVKDTTLSVSIIGETDWQNRWKDYYHAQDVTRWLTIVPEWEHVEFEDRLTVYLDPEVTFGTGYHPTTRLALGFLGDELMPDDTVIDVGTGSGVLAIIADLLGASQVYAFDNDPACEQAVAHNLSLNTRATHTTFAVKDMLHDVSETADIIVANILSEVLLPLIPQTVEHLNPDGKLILSGIYKDQYENIQAQLAAYHFEIVESRKRGDWYAVLAMQSEEK